MMIDQILGFYHPTTLVILDDEQNSIDMLTMQLLDDFNVAGFTDAAAAQDAIVQRSVLPTTLLKTQHTNDSDALNTLHVQVDLNQVHRLIYNPQRFEQASVLIVDYHMPAGDGVSFCRQLTQPGLQKILLTVGVDKDVAIAAFNAGDIDRFILKNSNTLRDDLLQALQALTTQYFARLAQPLLDALPASTQALLHQPAYLQVFNQAYKQAQAVEYYLLDSAGSFLFLDANAQATWLLIRSEADFAEQQQMLQGLAGGKAICDGLRKREHLLFLLTDAEHKAPLATWQQHLFPAQRLADHHYYALVSGPLGRAIDWSALTAFSATRI